jgi:hypothetical protein
MRPLALMGLLVLAAAADLAPASSRAQDLAAAPLTPSTLAAYPTFGLSFWRPFGAQPTEERGTRPDGARYLAVSMALKSGAIFRAWALVRDTGEDRADPETLLASVVPNGAWSVLHQTPLTGRRVWEVHTVEQGRKVRSRLFGLPAHTYLLQSIAGPSGEYDAGTYDFFSTAKFTP